MSYHHPHLRMQPLKRAMANEDRLTPAQFRDRMDRATPAHLKPGPRPIAIYGTTFTTGTIGTMWFETMGH